MKKKNLIILLLIPFIISLLSIVTINATFSQFNSDISSIEWDYKDTESFKITSSKYLLSARGVTTSSNPLAPGNDLVWKVENQDKSIDYPLAEIVSEGGLYYLVPKHEGFVTITCSNQKGNVFRKMTAALYKNGFISVQPVILGSGSNIDNNIYYGEYDYQYSSKTKVPAEIKLAITCYPNNLLDSLEIVDVNGNIVVNQSELDVVVKIQDVKENQPAGFKVKSSMYDNILPSTFSFVIVDKGVNVYDYDTLLQCTNKPGEGEIVVLRKSFESEKGHVSSGKNNVTMFGKKNKNGYDFSKEAYKFTTSFNTEYIKQWNAFAYTNKYKTVTNELYAGLRIKKDFYGNGYTINFHNLAFPTSKNTYNGVTTPDLGKDDLFRGPLPFYTLGDPSSILSVVTTYGQDNVGMLIDAEGVVVNDVNVKNCDTPDSLSFFKYTGTVMEINADNVVVKNSRVQNGKNVIRSFSAMNFKLKNSLVSTCMNFLVTTGSNEYIKVNETASHDFVSYNGNKVRTTTKDYLNTEVTNKGNDLLNQYLNSQYSDNANMRDRLKEIQTALNYGSDKLKTMIKGSMTIEDVYFENSGIAAICLETLFNGPFLYSASPSDISGKFDSVGAMIGTSLVPLTPTNISGISYPVTVDITGNTKFYDYKVAKDVDLSGLIGENISTIIGSTGIDFEFSIDTIFPLKEILVAGAKSDNAIVTSEEKQYINIPVAFYGGGINLSTVNYNGQVYQDKLSTQQIDLLEKYLGYKSDGSQFSNYYHIMLKSVPVVIGFEPFEFICVKDGHLFGENANAEDLYDNAGGEN